MYGMHARALADVYIAINAKDIVMVRMDEIRLCVKTHETEIGVCRRIS